MKETDASLPLAGNVSQFAKLWYLVDKRTRHACAALLGLLTANAAIEAVGIGMVLPVIYVIGSDDWQSKSEWLAWFHTLAGSPSRSSFLIMCLAALGVVYAFKGVFSLITSYASLKTLFTGNIRLSERLFAGYLHAPYTFHLEQNSTTLTRYVVMTPGDVFGSMLRPCLSLIAEGMIMIGVLATLFILQPQQTLVVIALFSCTVAGYYFIAGARLFRRGKHDVDVVNARLKWVGQAMSTINEIRVNNAERFVEARYAVLDKRWMHNRLMVTLIGDGQRPIMEVIGIVALTGGASLLIWQHNGVTTAVLETMGLFGVAMVRLLPTANRISFNLGNLRFVAAALDALYSDLTRVEGHVPPPHSTVTEAPVNVELSDLTYRYPGATRPALSNLNLTIRRGTSIAIVGPSGSGKTTLANLLIGLLDPSEGAILADGLPISCASPQWRSRIGFIPQDIFLLDDTLRRNVAFGLSDAEIDDDRVRAVLSQAQLDNLLIELPDGLDTQLGERGLRISGGQRQRVAIARALYRDPEILIMDEATSALDMKTEQEINEAVHALAGERTVIVVAHRTTTVRDLDTLHLLIDGRLEASGSFDNLERSSPAFREIVLGQKLPSEDAMNDAVDRPW